MTDSRFREQWLNDRRFRRLSPEAFRLYVVANTWSASNRTDGALPNEDVADFPRWWCADPPRIAELVTAGLWLESGDGWQIAGFASHQTTAAQLASAEHARVLARERKARQRARERVSADSDDVTRDVPRDDTGQDRTGQEEEATTYVSDAHARDEPPDDPWPTGDPWADVSAEIGSPAPEPSAPSMPAPEARCSVTDCHRMAGRTEYGYPVCDAHAIRRTANT